MRVRTAGGVAVALALALLPAAPARADFQGSDVVANVSPPSQLDPGALVERHPPGHYTLDTHVDVGLTNPAGAIELVPHVLASQLWDASKLLVTTTITLFTWAFALDLLAGDGARPGALAPIADAVHTLYQHTFGRSWLLVALLLAGLWGTWKALVQRRYSETAGQLALSALYIIVALFLVAKPAETILQANEWTNRMSLAFLSGATAGSIDQPHRAKREVADHLFRTLVYQPWVVLNFGGLSHCVDDEHRPVPPGHPERTRCIDHVEATDGRGGYAERFLRHPPDSDARTGEYLALRDGAIPTSDSLLEHLLPGLGDRIEIAPAQFAGYVVDEDDRPAVDIQQAGGGTQRLTMAALVLAGSLGAVALLGALSLAVILAQIFVLCFLAFAPVALVAAAFPARGHDLFRAWLAKLAAALLRKALYSLILAIVLAVATALAAATNQLGWLLAFGLQTTFYWAVFLSRRHITARLTHATTGTSRHDRDPTDPHLRARALTRIVTRATRHRRTPAPPPTAPQKDAPHPDDRENARRSAPAHVNPASLRRSGRPTSHTPPAGARGRPAEPAGRSPRQSAPTADAANAEAAQPASETSASTPPRGAVRRREARPRARERDAGPATRGQQPRTGVSRAQRRPRPQPPTPDSGPNDSRSTHPRPSQRPSDRDAPDHGQGSPARAETVREQNRPGPDPRAVWEGVLPRERPTPPPSRPHPFDKK